MSKYVAMRNRHQTKINAFPMFFAFSEQQFNEGMARFGLAPDETDKLCRISQVGGFCLKTDAPALREMWDRHEKDLADAIAGDKTGEGFIFDMFMYELSNHEYTYTYRVDDAVDALGLSDDDFENNPALRHGLQKACEAQRAWADAQE